jgi:hypothetical protein
MRTGSSFEQLSRSSDRELEALFAASPPPDFDSLVGFEWRGYNTDPNLRYLGLKKFIKTFFRAQYGDEGCNIKVFQNAFTEAWTPRMRQGKVDAFAFYLVRPQDTPTRLERNPRALLIDYAASPRNPVYHVERTIRDYLVRPVPDDPDVMLGRAFVGIGRVRVVSSFFLIQRGAPFTWPV